MVEGISFFMSAQWVTCYFGLFLKIAIICEVGLINPLSYTQNIGIIICFVLQFLTYVLFHRKHMHHHLSVLWENAENNR